MKSYVHVKSNKIMKGNLGLHDALPQPEFPKIPKSQVWINAKLSKERRHAIIKHERFENYMMRKKHLDYHAAHKIAQKWEKY